MMDWIEFVCFLFLILFLKDHMIGEPRIPAGDDVVIGGYHSWEAQARAEATGSKLDM